MKCLSINSKKLNTVFMCIATNGAHPKIIENTRKFVQHSVLKYTNFSSTLYD
jgi:hypothetical protein